MARTENFILKGLSGLLGKSLMFRQFRGKTIVCKSPTKSRVPPTEEQTACRNKVQEAVRYAQKVLKDPEQRAIYEAMSKVKKGKVSVYNAAITAYMNDAI